MSFIEMEKWIKKVGYTNMKCTWYCNHRFSFSGADVLKFVEDVRGYDLVDVYVEHCVDTPDIVYGSKLGHKYFDNDDVVEDVGGKTNISDHN